MVLKRNKVLFLLQIPRIQIPWRAGVTSEAVVHFLAVNFKGDEQVFVGEVRVNAEFGKIAEETFAGVANVMGVGEGLFRLGEESLDFVTGQFGHGVIVRPNPLGLMWIHSITWNWKFRYK